MPRNRRENSLGASSKAAKASTRNQSPHVKPPAGYDLATPQETEVGFVAAYAALDLLMRLGTPHPEQRSHRTLNIHGDLELSLTRYRSSTTKPVNGASDDALTTIVVEASYLGRSVMTVEWIPDRERKSPFKHMEYTTGPWIAALLAHHQLQLQDKE